MKLIKRVESAGLSSCGIGRVSEDAWCIGVNYAAVFDGATPASKCGPYVALPGMTDAHWIANAAAKIFPQCIDGIALDSIVPQLMWRLSDEFHKKSKLIPEWMGACECPSTTASFVIKRDDKLHFFQIGDSPILIQFENGDIKFMEGDPVLVENDRKIHDVLRHLRNHNRDLSLKDLNNLRKKHIPPIRHQMNRHGGYGVLSVQPPEVLNMQRLSLNASKVKGFILMTDGLMEVLDVFRCTRIKETFYRDLFDPIGLEVAHMALRDLQAEADPEGYNFPRIKKGDDVVALRLVI